MNFFQICILSLMLILVIGQPLKIILQMDQLTNITEPQNIINVTLKPGQSFIYHTDFLQPLTYFSQNCRSLRGELVQQVLANFIQTKDGVEYQHVYSEKFGMIYRLQHENLIAYRFSSLTHQLQEIQRVDFKNSHCQGSMILSENDQFLYHFSCDRVTKIDMTKSLTGISNAYKNEERFYGFKVVRGRRYFVWVSFSEGIKIFGITRQDQLELTQTIQPFQQKIVDAIIHQNRLYLLGLQKNLYIYDYLGTGKLRERQNISLESICPECRNRQILVYKQNIFIYSKVNGEQFITQLQVTKNLKNASLVRYFKGRKNFITMDIFNGRLLVVFKLYINLYEINRDPRTIKTLSNGISNSHFERITKMERISDHMFIKQSQTLTSIIKLSIRTPSLQCHYKKQIQQIEQISINQPCRLEQNKIYKEGKYSTSCSSVDKINIRVLKDKDGYHHIVAVILVFIFCMLVIAVLIIWRKNKMQLIQNIVIQINRFKNRRREQQIQFVQQKNPTRQSNWNDIHETEQPESKNKSKPQLQKQYELGSEQNSNKSKEQKQIEKQKEKDKSKHEQLNEEIQEQIQDIDPNVQASERNMIK